MKTLSVTVLLAIAGAALSADAEPMRLMLSQEAKVPGVRQWEAGAFFWYNEITDKMSLASDDNYAEFAPYARYGLSRDVSLSLEVPITRTEIDGDDAYGFGDLRLGAHLVGYRDALGYPYVMPYARLSLPTGDEDDKLGRGETQVQAGIAIGTTVADDWDFVLDAGFVARSKSDNAFQIGGAIVYNFHREFSLLGEVRYEASSDDDVDDTTTLLGGLVYRPAPAWLLGVYGGTWTGGDADENLLVAVKIARSFD